MIGSLISRKAERILLRFSGMSVLYGRWTVASKYSFGFIPRSSRIVDRLWAISENCKNGIVHSVADVQCEG